MTPHPVQIVARRRGSIAVVELIGEFDPLDASHVGVALVGWLTTDPRVVICDLSRLAVPDPQQLLEFLAAVQRRSGTWPQSALHLAAATPAVADQLIRLRFDRCLPLHDSVELALREAILDAADVRRIIQLPPGPSSARLARVQVALLWPEDLAAAAAARERAVLVASELATNAVRHVGEPFLLSVTLSRGRFLVAVTDVSATEPRRRPLSPESASGRGLHLVQALTQAWGVRLIHRHGKTVWAAFTLSPELPDRGPAGLPMSVHP